MMKVQIERPYIEAMADEFPEFVALKEQLRFGRSTGSIRGNSASM